MTKTILTLLLLIFVALPTVNATETFVKQIDGTDITFPIPEGYGIAPKKLISWSQELAENDSVTLNVLNQLIPVKTLSEYNSGKTPPIETKYVITYYKLPKEEEINPKRFKEIIESFHSIYTSDIMAQIMKQGISASGADESKSIIYECEKSGPSSDNVQSNISYKYWHSKDSNSIVESVEGMSFVYIKGEIICIIIEHDGSDKEQVKKLLTEYTSELLKANDQSTQSPSQSEITASARAYGMLTFKCQNDPRSGGINFIIDYPESLKAESVSNNKNMIQRFKIDDNRARAIIALDVISLPENPLVKPGMSLREVSDIYAEVIYNMPDNYFLKGMTGTVSRELGEINSLPVCLTVTNTTLSESVLQIPAIFAEIDFFIGNKYIKLGYNVLALGNPAPLEDVYMQHLPDLFKMAKSLQITY